MLFSNFVGSHYIRTVLFSDCLDSENTTAAIVSYGALKNDTPYIDIVLFFLHFLVIFGTIGSRKTKAEYR